ncbi:MAG: hypothetical protein IJU55_05400 [Selenomonadaceae bacterium]|nr:hypothetical protein [Selenomonadaceae bacterium]
MYPANYSEVDVIDFLQQVGNLFEHYLANREATLTRREKNFAALQMRCEELKRREELLKTFSKNFFKEREKVSQLATKALDSAILLGDENIAAIALEILNDEYSKDFCDTVNKIGGIL